MARIVRVGLIKAVPEKWNLEANWALFQELAVRASRRGAQIVCTPECFLDGYVTTDQEKWSETRFRAIAQPRYGEGYLQRAMDLARECGIHLVFGFTERAETGCYNAAALIDDTGTLLGVYHKTHLMHHDLRYLPGQSLSVWQTRLGQIGILICADRRWPEAARTLKVRGAEVILNPTYGVWHLANEWWMRTRSYENELFICFTHPNVSLITDPSGEVAAKLQSNLPDVLVHDIDLDQVRYQMFAHRRPDLYDMGKRHEDHTD